ncbi:MAG: hypothetical protein WAL45_18240 [Terracidiphilus sp.]
MRSILWVLVLLPPCVTLIVWLKPRTAFGPKKVPGYTFWIVLAIMYVVVFAAALLEHKL